MIEIETRRFSTVLQFSNWKHYIYWPIFIQFLVFGWISDCGSLASAPTRATLAGFTCKSYKGPRWLFLNLHRAILNWSFYCVCVWSDSVCTTSWKLFTYGVWFFAVFLQPIRGETALLWEDWSLNPPYPKSNGKPPRENKWKQRGVGAQ